MTTPLLRRLLVSGCVTPSLYTRRSSPETRLTRAPRMTDSASVGRRRVAPYTPDWRRLSLYDAVCVKAGCANVPFQPKTLPVSIGYCDSDHGPSVRVSEPIAPSISSCLRPSSS
ncbi:hypothetical protein FQZ97_1245510 [compost metagenome]